MAQSREPLTLFEKDAGWQYNYQAAPVVASELKALRKAAIEYARANKVRMSVAVEKLHPNTWDDTTRVFVCTYDLRKILIGKGN